MLLDRASNHPNCRVPLPARPTRLFRQHPLHQIYLKDDWQTILCIQATPHSWRPALQPDRITTLLRLIDKAVALRDGTATAWAMLQETGDLVTVLKTAVWLWVCLDNRWHQACGDGDSHGA